MGNESVDDDVADERCRMFDEWKSAGVNDICCKCRNGECQPETYNNTLAFETSKYQGRTIYLREGDLAAGWIHMQYYHGWQADYELFLLLEKPR